MNMSFYNAAVGAQQQQNRMNVQANNIANVNTFGFKAKAASFQQLMYGNVRGIDEEELPRGTGTQMVKASTNFAPGNMADTGRDFDFAINGRGFFALYNLNTQEISYTRDGSFAMSEFLVPAPVEEGEEVAVDENGNPVDENGNPILVSEWRLTNGNGSCVLDPRGNFIVITDPKAELDVGVFDYMIYDGMLHADDSRFLPTEKSGNLYWGTGTVQRGYLEMSNVDLALEFTKVIESQRAYTYALKMVQTSDEIETTINGLRG